jgi:hypothetical protein
MSNIDYNIDLLNFYYYNNINVDDDFINLNFYELILDYDNRYNYKKNITSYILQKINSKLFEKNLINNIFQYANIKLSQKIYNISKIFHILKTHKILVKYDNDGYILYHSWNKRTIVWYSNDRLDFYNKFYPNEYEIIDDYESEYPNRIIEKIEQTLILNKIYQINNNINYYTMYWDNDLWYLYNNYIDIFQSINDIENINYTYKYYILPNLIKYNEDF